MAARAIGSGTISFGLVNIPVKVYAATESAARISFNQLHDKCKSRLRQQMYCPVDDEVVTREHIVKGYEFAKDQYVLFSPEELKALEEESTKQIEISEFVPLAAVDPLYFESGYFLGPDKGAERPYRLLARALEESQHAAVARYANRGKEDLVLIRPRDGALIMEQLRYADELRSLADVPLGEGEVKGAELQLAKQLVSQLSSETFDAGKYHDRYRKRLQEIIEQKIKGEPVVISAPEAASPQVIDLMEALKASLAKRGVVPASKETPDLVAERKPPKRAGVAPPGAAKKRSRKA
ncbi:MAG TPA: Ku protein [Myxococcaceae bacterium]|jgi:DNA end-binding protein Ku|nr:Ku protein [Myxococcaceae bacterium]